MALVQLDLGVNIPSVGDRPPLVSVGTHVKVNTLQAIVGGAIAAAIVWVAVGMPWPTRTPAVEETDDAVVPARFGRAP